MSVLPRLVSAVLALLPLGGALRANDELPAPPQTQPVVLRGATIHPVTGPDVPDGEIVFEGGKITAVGRGLTVPAGARVIDVAGKHVYPGLISAHTSLGLTEIQSVRGNTDSAEVGSVNPNARAQVVVNADSELLPIARANGVLTALVVPKTADGLVSGVSSLLHLDGWTWESMTVKADVGLHVFWPDLRVNRDPRFPVTAGNQQIEIDRRLRNLRELFGAARAYQQAVDAGHPGRTDLRLAALGPILRGELSVFVHADSERQIEDAVRWAGQEKLRLVLVGGQDAWRVADLLKERGVPVIVSPVDTIPLRRGEAYDAAYANPGKLHAAGVRFCIANEGSDFDAAHDRNLPYQAGQAAAHGLPREEALRAISLYPAQILGVADRLGSLEAGKDATFIVTSGDPLEVMTQVEAAFIDGRPVDLSNRQTRLYEKYKRKYAP